MSLRRRDFLAYLGLAASAAACGKSDSGASAADAALPTDAGADQPPRAGEGGGAGAVDAAQSDADSGPSADPACSPTQADALGPFFRDGAPSRMVIADAAEPGERMVITGRVVDEDCRPVAAALLDVWQADMNGDYDLDSVEYRLRGQVLTGEDGAYRIETIRPGNYPDLGGVRPAHLHFMIGKPGFRQVATQLYFEGDPYLAPNDSCTGCGSDDAARITPLVTRDGVLHGELEIVLARA